MRIDIFVVVTPVGLAFKVAGNAWFRYYHEASEYVSAHNLGPCQIQKWSVRATADGGGTPVREDLNALGID